PIKNGGDSQFHRLGFGCGYTPVIVTPLILVHYRLRVINAVTVAVISWRLLRFKVGRKGEYGPLITSGNWPLKVPHLCHAPSIGWNSPTIVA
ncbi:hypothetical protein B0H14DRAFT_3888808, partial [Mycena olivaceomarginata]